MSGLRPSWPQLSSFHSSLLRRLRLRSSAERGNSQLTLICRPVDGSGHLFPVLLAVLQIVDARQFGDHVLEGRVRRDVVDPRAVDPDLAAILETGDVAPAGHRAEH